MIGVTVTEKGCGGLYYDKPEKWRDEDVPEEYWEDFIKGQKEMLKPNIGDCLMTSSNTRRACDNGGECGCLKLIPGTENVVSKPHPERVYMDEFDFDKWDYDNALVPDE